jgi:hypothetical protein
MDIKKYVDYLFDIQRENLRKEISKLFEECKVDPKRYTMFLECVGINYVIRDLISDIYLSGLYIEKNIMLKIAIFNLVMENNLDIFRINDNIRNEKNDWWKEKIIKEKKELKEKVMVEVNKLADKFKKYRSVDGEISCSNCINS